MMSSGALHIAILFFLASCASDIRGANSPVVITSDTLAFIQRVPCAEPDGRCSFRDFIALRGEANFLHDWMLVLYFDFEKYSSHDLMTEILPGYLHGKLFRHRILVGRVLCNTTSMKLAKNAALCNDVDPSVIYAYQDGQRTEFWWSIADVLSQRAFVLGNLLTLQYKGHMDLMTGAKFEAEVPNQWAEDPGTHKFLLAVHLATAGMEVNSTDRVRAFDLVGLVVRTIPNVRVVVVSGVISQGLEFWWYDSNFCPKLNDSGCSQHRIYLHDFEGKAADNLLCELEQFSAGIDSDHSLIDLRKRSARDEESSYRLLQACPYFFFNAGPESFEELHKLTKMISLSYETAHFLSVIGDKEVAQKALISHGADLELAKEKILFKFHSENVNENYTDVFSRLTTPSGLQINIRPYSGPLRKEELEAALRRVFGEEHFIDNYEDLDGEYNPYTETDEIFTVLTTAKTLKSEHFLELNTKAFRERTSVEKEPAVVLFYQSWSSGSLFARDLIFPIAAQQLANRFNQTARLYAVNCFNENEVCEKEDIKHYPVVKFFVHGKARFFTGVVSLLDIVRETVFLNRSAFVEVNSATEMKDLLALSGGLQEHVLFGVGIAEPAVRKEFERVALQFEKKVLFILTAHQHLPEDLRAQIVDKTIVSYSERLRPSLFRKDSTSTADLPAFVESARFNRVMELTWQLFQDLAHTRRPLLILLVQQMTPALRCLLTSIAVQRTGQFHVTWLYTAQRKDFPIFKDIDSPTLIFRLRSADAFYRWNVNETALDATQCTQLEPELDQWLSDITEGKSSAQEFLASRSYPPLGPHINCVDEIYPLPKEPAKSSTMKSNSLTSEKDPVTSESNPMTSEKDPENAGEAAKSSSEVPISVDSVRDEL